MGQRLAAEGYVVLVPNPFYRNAKAPVVDGCPALAVVSNSRNASRYNRAPYSLRDFHAPRAILFLRWQSLPPRTPLLHSHNHAVVVNSFWPFWYPGYPYAHGYPYLSPPIFNDSDNYDSQPASNYAAPQPDVPYQTQPYPPQSEDQPEPPAPPDSFPQQPNPSHLGHYNGAPSPPSSAPPVTLIFKDGRPPEQIYNYLLTANTLTVLDQNRRDIPVSQIDVDATAKANLQAGVTFSSCSVGTTSSSHKFAAPLNKCSQSPRCPFT